MRDQDLLPDTQDFAMLGGQRMHKGSVGALLASALVLQDAPAIDAQREPARQDIAALAPALGTADPISAFQMRSPALRAEVARHRISPSPTAYHPALSV